MFCVHRQVHSAVPALLPRAGFSLRFGAVALKGDVLLPGRHVRQLAGVGQHRGGDVKRGGHLGGEDVPPGQTVAALAAGLPADRGVGAPDLPTWASADRSSMMSPIGSWAVKMGDWSSFANW